jgi:hypothetical protein
MFFFRKGAKFNPIAKFMLKQLASGQDIFLLKNNVRRDNP